jgi:hypothetical protein
MPDVFTTLGAVQLAQKCSLVIPTKKVCFGTFCFSLFFVLLTETFKCNTNLTGFFINKMV